MVYGPSCFHLAHFHVLQTQQVMSANQDNTNTNTTHPLSFEELSDKAQERALMNWEPFTEWDWWEDEVENWYERMQEEYGIEGDDMSWDDDFSPWFIGKVEDNEKFINKIMPGLIEKSKNKFMQMEYGLQPDFWQDLYITFSHYRGRNPHANQMTCEVEDADEISAELADELKDKGRQAIIDELKKFGRELSNQWDYMTSWEAAREEFAANDTKFRPDGTVWE